VSTASKRELNIGSSDRIGRMARIFDEQDILLLLRAAVEREGSQSAFARRYGVNRVSVNKMLARKLGVSEDIKNALGLRKTYTPRMPDESAT
jgi:hypothetical protein